MSLTEYKTLGRSGLRVSPFCLGAMTFGEEWKIGTTREESCRVIDAYIERGGNFIDTANIYNSGHSEKILGDHLCHDRRKRDRVVIATKFGGNLFAGDSNGGGAGRKAVIAQCEESLRRLRTDFIDLYWLHFWDPHTPPEETLRALDDLVRDGKVRYVGFSDAPAWRCAQAQMMCLTRGWTPLAAIQVEYSLLERTVEGELIPMAMEFGLGVTPWSPLKGGLLTGKYTRDRRPAEGRGSTEWITRHLNERTFALVDVLSGVAREAGATPAQAALAWLRGRPGVTSTIIGARTLPQLEENLRALSVTLSAEHAQRLDAASTPALNFPHDFLKFVTSVIHGGISINGQTPSPWGSIPKSDAERH